MIYEKNLFGHSDDQIFISYVYLVFVHSSKNRAIGNGCLVINEGDFWTQPRVGPVAWRRSHVTGGLSIPPQALPWTPLRKGERSWGVSQPVANDFVSHHCVMNLP